MPTLAPGADLRFAARLFRKNPGFSLIAILSMALGIGASSAIFSLVYAVLLDPYPYKNAERIVAMLRQHDAVTGVHYPDQDEVARKQMTRFGGMVSFRVKGGEQQALDICSKTRIFTLAESLGGVESLIEHPGRMTHASAAGSPLEVPSDLVRLSVGIEDPEDLLADLRLALG